MSSDLSIASLLEKLAEVVGSRHLLTGDSKTLRFRTGYRYGAGRALAVVRPGTLVQTWQALSHCVEAGVIVVMQAANTGLTGGSTPYDDDYPRPVVIINTMRLSAIHPISDGKEVICLAGSTLYDLETILAPLGREPHSVIGSSCLGASVIGGVCNNSGGALVRRGPTFTEQALFVRRDAEGRLHLVNHLGAVIDGDPVAVLEQIDKGDLEHLPWVPATRIAGDGYDEIVRAVDAGSPARFNADPRNLHEASGCAGRVAVLAVRLPTFAKPSKTAHFCIGTDDPRDLTQLRRAILTKCKSLPVLGEYMHRDAMAMAETHGRDTMLALKWLGTARLPALFRARSWVDAFSARLGLRSLALSDRLLHLAGRILPLHVPPRVRRFRKKYAHYLLIEMADDGIEDVCRVLESMPPASGDVLHCTDEEAAFLLRQRFAVAGAAIRYRALHAASVSGLVTIDVALRRNDNAWWDMLPGETDREMVAALHYGHFFCHVFHRDYLIGPGADEGAIASALHDDLDARQARYPAEHNVGHVYHADAVLCGFYRDLDPGNMFNPGIGKTSRLPDWG